MVGGGADLSAPGGERVQRDAAAELATPAAVGVAGQLPEDDGFFYPGPLRHDA